MFEFGMNPRFRNAAALFGFFAACFAVSGAGALFTLSSVGSWYAELTKPPFNPPDWIFGPVWTALYAMMAIAVWRVWREPASAARKPGLLLFWIQLTLNLLWSALFFGLQNPGLALLNILLLLFSIAATCRLFFRSDRTAGWLLVPYLAWVSFASVLNASIWFLNP